MNKTVLTLLLFLIGFGSARSQVKTIETVSSKSYAPVGAISSGATGADAFKMILGAVQWAAAYKCSKDMGESLSKVWDKTRGEYVQKIPKGKEAEFLVLVDKFNCSVLAMVPTDQTIRIREGVCSVDDVKLAQPALIFDPDRTGFFLIRMKN